MMEEQYNNLQVPAPVVIAIDKSDIESLSVSLNDCVICLEKKDEPDTIVKLCCGHTYHTKCADEYFKKLYISNLDITCPLCRTTLEDKTSNSYIVKRLTIIQTLPITQRIHAIHREGRCFARTLICIPFLLVLIFVLGAAAVTNIK